jgi:hypothetical protein
MGDMGRSFIAAFCNMHRFLKASLILIEHYSSMKNKNKYRIVLLHFFHEARYEALFDLVSEVLIFKQRHILTVYNFRLGTFYDTGSSW